MGPGPNSKQIWKIGPELVLEMKQSIGNKFFFAIFASAKQRADFLAQRPPCDLIAVAFVASEIVYEGSPQYLVGQRDQSIGKLCQVFLHFGLRVADAQLFKRTVERAAEMAWNNGTYKPSDDKLQEIVKEAEKEPHANNK